jgi:hypothetical protein
VQVLKEVEIQKGEDWSLEENKQRGTVLTLELWGAVLALAQIDGHLLEIELVHPTIKSMDRDKRKERA